ncbi:MAG: VWA domain-containing protein [Acidobacteria bacterium]|nr:VWA domain-containing protein [Acidobacteriota bacterium]
MERKTQTILLFVFCIALTFAFYNFSTTTAQTTPTTERPRQIPSPTPPTIGTPPPLPIEDKDDIIKIDTDLVNLNVRVVDRNNRAINNLTQADFKVYEESILQPIEFFSKSEVPTNYSLVIDNSGSLRFQLEKVIEAGKIIIGTNRPDDETSIIRFVSSDKINIEQDFTSNKTDLTDALDNLYIEGGQTAIIDAVYLAAERVETYEKKRNDLKRRALILVSDGEDRDSFYKEPQLYQLLRESDVQIFVIGFVNELSKEGGFISKSPQGKAKAFLERLATETGGKVYFPNNLSELNGIAQEIANELRTQYSIGYSPTNKVQDGTFRNLKIVIADGANKEKRIAITRSGITRSGDNTKPSLQKPNQKPNKK